MRKLYCDACGKDLDAERLIYSVEIKYKGCLAPAPRIVDLCWKCKEEFKEYIDKCFDREDSNEGN